MIAKMNKPRREDILHEMSPVAPDSSRVDMTVVTKKRSTAPHWLFLGLFFSPKGKL